MSLPRALFGSVCSLVNGKAFKPADWSTAGVPIIRIQNLNGSDKPFNYWAGSLDKQVLVKTGDLLLAWSGTPGTSFGAHIWSGPNGILNQHIFRCDLDQKACTKEWARIALNHRLHRLIEQAHGGVGLQHVTRGMVEELEIPLPPLVEQRRIAELLGRGEALRAKRRAALAHLGSLSQSIFLEMFGDPVQNPKRWERVPLSEVLERVESGWSPICLDRPVSEDEWGVLKLGAVTWCQYDSGKNKALPPGVEPDPTSEVKVGDLLFVRKNTHELVAACALVHETPPRLMIPDLIFRLKLLPKAPIDPTFLHQILIYPTKRRDIQKLASGSAGSMPNISKARLMEAEVEIPPLKLQLEFARHVKSIARTQSVARISLEEMNELFASLQHRAFRGEL